MKQTNKELREKSLAPNTLQLFGNARFSAIFAIV